MKKWVADKVKELAERGIMGWKIKAEMPIPVDNPSQDEEEKSRPDGGPPRSAVEAIDDGPASIVAEPNQHTLFSLLPKVHSFIQCRQCLVSDFFKSYKAK